MSIYGIQMATVLLEKSKSNTGAFSAQNKF
jgi:hypothetical protein